ncbi:acyl-CoA dehydrogenase [Aeromicrobium choanae]|uniref:3-methylmercaptopropionyl-CoA dehydrogenase n=1 Tax=Aeromicrobium choanae TaxID=1736691 RepID=A0A1T4YRL3_9ACTN|nr:acyl-CoA dehydrogenase [Aeromicrobium choanae]SKB04494.1 Acyl-CoA dehydrogenase [Aeromicrobium choanae]
MAYKAPVADYDFLWRHVLDAERQLLDMTGGALGVDDAAAVFAAAADFAVSELHPLNASGDREGSVLRDGRVVTPTGFDEAFRGYARGGWMGVEIPTELGGEGMPHLLTAPMGELWSAANSAFGLCTGLTVGAIHAIGAVGSPEQKQTFLSPMVEGRWTGTMNLTEPQAGTDLAAIRTTATPNEDGSWRVRGQKIFITWGDHELSENIVHLVLARTPGAPDGLAGLSLFIVPKFRLDANGAVGERNDITTVALEHKLGIHASPTCVLEYENATGYLLGDLHRGLTSMFVMMNVSRMGIGVQGLGIADRAHQQARDYAQQRLQGTPVGRDRGTPIAGHPDVARLLTSSASLISAARGVLVQVALWQDLAEQGDETARAAADFFSPIVKGWFTEESVRITSDAVQVHGGAGFIEETGVAQHYRDARITPIYEGTTAIQANDLVGRKVIRDSGAVASTLLDAIDKDIVDLRAVDHEVVDRTVERLERAVALVRQATATLVSRSEERPRDVQAASVNYLTMWGLLAGGWMLARSVTAALRVDDVDTRRRTVEADFYGAHHLSRIASLHEALIAGEIA